MNNVIAIFKQLQDTSSSNEKQAIVKANSDNELFKDCLVFLLDTNVVTGISSKKLSKQVTCTTNKSLHSWKETMNFLTENNTGTDEIIVIIQNYLKTIPDEDLWFYKGMITKTLKLGMTKKNVNKVIPNLIATYETQQAYPLSDKNMPKDGSWFSLSEKLNGTNAGYINGKFLSRQGKPFKNFEHIEKDIIALGLDDYYINGEFIRRNVDNLPDNDNFQKSVAIINSDLEDKSEILFVFYEIITKEEFYNGKSYLRYKDRLLNYKAIQKKIDELELKNIKFVNHFYEGTDLSQIQKWLNYADLNNMEGCMLNKDTHWENKRNNGILKVKSFHTCDVKVLRIEKGEITGKYANTLGRIICNYKGFELGVGSGFEDSTRDYYWNNPNEIVGKLVTIKYKAETKNKNGGVSVQFPTFVCIRNDKSEESYED